MVLLGDALVTRTEVPVYKRVLEVAGRWQSCDSKLRPIRHAGVPASYSRTMPAKCFRGFLVGY